MFKSDLKDVFDVAHSFLLSFSEVPQEDKDFLASQKEDQVSSSLAGVVQKNMEENEKQKRYLAGQAGRMKLDAEVTQLMKVTCLQVDGSSTETNTKDDHTTAVNAVMLKGTCICIKQQLSSPMLWLAQHLMLCS